MFVSQEKYNDVCFSFQILKIGVALHQHISTAAHLHTRSLPHSCGSNAPPSIRMERFLAKTALRLRFYCIHGERFSNDCRNNRHQSRSEFPRQDNDAEHQIVIFVKVTL